MNSYRPDAIANYFIRHCDPVATGLTPMKIQKLVYFAHGWHLALKFAPLITDQVEAWKYGPVIDRLYHALKDHDDSPVTDPIVKVRIISEQGKPVQMEPFEASIEDDPDLHPFVPALLQRVLKVYGKYSAIQLSKMTHEEGSPWHQVMKRFTKFLPQGVPIPDEMIRDYFLTKIPNEQPDTIHP